MIECLYIEDFEDFLEWYFKLNPQEIPDMHEAVTIYFNQDIYQI